MKKCSYCGEKESEIHMRTCKKRQSVSQVEIVGFHNRWGESNCFLNSALQIL